jgi:hypothetical protein
MTVGALVVAVITGVVATTIVAMAGTTVVVVVVPVVTPTRRILRSRRMGPCFASIPTLRRPLRGTTLHTAMLAS